MIDPSAMKAIIFNSLTEGNPAEGRRYSFCRCKKQLICHLCGGRVPGSAYECHCFLDSFVWFPLETNHLAGAAEGLEQSDRYVERYRELGGRVRVEPDGYWCKCFIAAAQRMMKKPIQSAAR